MEEIELVLHLGVDVVHFEFDGNRKLDTDAGRLLKRREDLGVIVSSRTSDRCCCTASVNSVRSLCTRLDWVSSAHYSGRLQMSLRVEEWQIEVMLDHEYEITFGEMLPRAFCPRGESSGRSGTFERLESR